VLVLLFAEDATQQKYVLCEIAFFNKTVGPDRSHQLVLAYYSASALHESEKDFERFGSNTNWPALVKE
jgi:hypothetical protein